ncbi:MAG: bifunctional hydroxymethylpyrimidine kinase/phosphomethylpyrimidine kinase [Rhodocyclaceae bacterium]|nr:bifunctional hydroxymethylpyrimidine kinase/phosphomethylpyrimidine kinase [Rhodocyclaceae bacterium]
MSAHTPPPLVLVFDSSDPTGATGLQGAAVTLAAFGCHSLPVATAISCGDTRSVEHVHVLDPEWVAEQARPVLEDVPVAAILVGDPGCPDTVGVIAEIATDYAAPLIFAPGSLRDSPDPDESDDLVVASLEMLLPETRVLVVDGTVALRMVAVGDDDGDACSDPQEAARMLLRCGAGSVLLAESRDAALQPADLLIGPAGILRTDTRPPVNSRVAGGLAALAAAVAAGMARGGEVEHAVREGHDYLRAAYAGAFTPGMGAALVDRIATLRRPA